MGKGIKMKDVNGNEIFPCPYYPVGSIYISVTNINPKTYFGGEWKQVATGRTLMGASSDEQLSKTVDSGLPNIKGQLRIGWHDNSASSPIMASFDSNYGALFATDQGTTHFAYAGGSGSYNRSVGLDASKYNSIYGKSDKVQPPALYVYFWERVA